MRRAHRIAKGLTATNLLAVAPEDTLGEVAQKMLEQETRTALVLDSGRIIGALSARELVHAVAERTHPSDGRVREWMVASREGDEGDGEFPGERVEAMCELAWETGHLEICRREVCTFWWKGECVLAGLAGDIAADPCRARFFLQLREETVRGGGARLHGLPGF
jgi:CBS domain-containing protein